MHPMSDEGIIADAGLGGRIFRENRQADLVHAAFCKGPQRRARIGERTPESQKCSAGGVLEMKGTPLDQGESFFF